MTNRTETIKLKHQIAGLLCCFAFSVLISIGWLGIAHFWLPAAADLSAEATKAFYTIDHRDGMLFGNSILIVGTALLVPGSIQFGLTLSEIEGPKPLWSITSATCGVLIAVIVFLNAGFWIGAAYRPEADADVIVAFNDTAWFGFLLGWVFLSMQMVATALVTLADPSPKPLVPHWLGKASIVGSVLLVTASGPAFAKSGPFAYHGLAAYYAPMAIWGVWLEVHVWLMIGALRSRLREASIVALSPPSREPYLGSTKSQTV